MAVAHVLGDPSIYLRWGLIGQLFRRQAERQLSFPGQQTACMLCLNPEKPSLVSSTGAESGVLGGIQDMGSGPLGDSICGTQGSGSKWLCGACRPVIQTSLILFCLVLGKGVGGVNFLEARKSVGFTLSELGPRNAEGLFQHPTGHWRLSQNQSVVSLKPTALSPSSGPI